MLVAGLNKMNFEGQVSFLLPKMGPNWELLKLNKHIWP